MATGYRKSKTKTLRSMDTPKQHEFPRGHRKFLIALLELCITEKIAFYVGALTTTGGIKLKFFAGDEVVEDYLSSYDDPANEVGRLADYLAGSQMQQEVVAYGARLEAQERLRGAESAHQVPTAKKPNSDA